MVSDTRSGARVDDAPDAAGFILLAVPAGVVLGVVSQRADDWSGWTGWLMSMFCVWLLACLVISRLARSLRSAAIGTAAMLVAAVLAYYVTFFLVADASPGSVIAVWLVLAALAGPFAGALGRATAAPGWPRSASAAAFSGFFLGEGLYVLLRAESPTRLPLVAVDISLGIILPLLLRARRGDRLRCYALIPAVVAGVMGLLWLLPVVVGILPE